ncbi:MAG: hypothetical protein ACO1OO_13145 [Flavisolibacter sp.]
MNQFFSFERFRLQVLKHWADNQKRYMLALLASTGLLFAWFVLNFFWLQDDIEDVQQGTYFFVLFAGGAIYTSQYFSHLASKTKASNLLLLPASTFEKLLCAIFYTVVLFYLVITASFYIADVLAVAVTNALADAGGKAKLINVFSLDFFYFYNDHQKLNFLLFFLSIQAVFLLGSVHFKRYSLIKTLISCFLIALTGMALLYTIHVLVTPVDIDEEMPNGMVMLLIVLAYAVAPLLWLASYFRLKSKQA